MCVCVCGVEQHLYSLAERCADLAHWACGGDQAPGRIGHGSWASPQVVVVVFVVAFNKLAKHNAPLSASMTHFLSSEKVAVPQIGHL